MCDFQPSKWLVAAVIALYIAVIVGSGIHLHLHIQGLCHCPLIQYWNLNLQSKTWSTSDNFCRCAPCFHL